MRSIRLLFYDLMPHDRSQAKDFETSAAAWISGGPEPPPAEQPPWWLTPPLLYTSLRAYKRRHFLTFDMGATPEKLFFCLLLCAIPGMESQAPQPCATIPSSAPWQDCVLAVEPQYGPLPATSVNFTTSDPQLQALYDHAVTQEASNVENFAPGFDVLVEGEHYNNVWLETQPMGGASYGVRNLRVALNNQLIFMRTQREDGRLPGMVTKTVTDGVVHPTYSYPGNANHSMLQGFYMASPAIDVALLMAAGGTPLPTVTAYLMELSATLEAFEAWLWQARNSSATGVLWLQDTADTGEDGSDKYRPLPSNPISPPFESMDMMGYAHDAERALARIAGVTGNASGVAHWQGRMATTAAALKARLWREGEGACFDRERDGQGAFVTTLLHNNLRAMWSGVMDRGMADAFVAQHLMNTSQFWTPTPLPSIAASDPRFQNIAGNNWGGPAEGLTYQRAIRALGSYGHHAEVVMLGALQRAALGVTGTFPQQINPLTSHPDHGDGYGPMILSLLEYTALTTGVAVMAEGQGGETGFLPSLAFSAIATNGTAGVAPSFTASLALGGTLWAVEGFGNGTFVGWKGGAQVFACTGSTRVVVSWEGVVTGVVGASEDTQEVVLVLGGSAPPPSGGIKLTVPPNSVWSIMGGGAPPVLVQQVPFTPPFK